LEAFAPAEVGIVVAEVGAVLQDVKPAEQQFRQQTKVDAEQMVEFVAGSFLDYGCNSEGLG